ncbi:MAG: hypothetical protein COV47_01655 [Candidatus Diapherotrites archaeon CG11_big_fil_rev_8_21_14_0_20_37_9]|nr:MAG: hypothetical protein COV47_01655 [Candidatus Diapherotrites archaeon CG11_big_fil_rev_8_21_14_0_20_37_9]
MANFYFDIETTGLDPRKDKIITIQYQELDRNTGEAIGELVILKEWELTERGMLEKFLKDSKIDSNYPFDFIPTGYNLTFEHNFMRERTAKHSFNPIDILSKPFIDLRSIGVLMNKGEFKGSGLDQITEKQSDGRNIPVWYNSKEYGEIETYIVNETKAFIKFNAWLYRKMPGLLERFRKENKIQ